MKLKELIIFSLLIALAISLFSNMSLREKEQNYTEVLLEEYMTELERSQSLLDKYLQQEASETWLYDALSSLESTLKIAELLGKHENKYSLSNNVEVYLEIPDTMIGILRTFSSDSYSREDIEKASDVFQNMIKRINSSNIQEPDKMKQIYRESELEENDLVLN